jgi:hypothetical protein
MKKYFCFLLLACGRNKYDLVDKSLQFEEIKNTFEVAKEHQLLAYFYDGDNPYLLYLSTILNQQKFCLTAEDILFKEHYIILDQIDRLDAVFAFASVTLLNLGRKDMESSLWKLEGMRIENVALENDPFAWLRPNAVI